MKMLDKICIGTMIRANMAKDKVKEFLQEQDGVSNVVATIIILLIVVLLIGAFWDRLKEWINTAIGRIMTASTATCPRSFFLSIRCSSPLRF